MLENNTRVLLQLNVWEALRLFQSWHVNKSSTPTELCPNRITIEREIQSEIELILSELWATTLSLLLAPGIDVKKYHHLPQFYGDHRKISKWEILKQAWAFWHHQQYCFFCRHLRTRVAWVALIIFGDAFRFLLVLPSFMFTLSSKTKPSLTERLILYKS
jgi:hypothetical protein